MSRRTTKTHITNLSATGGSPLSAASWFCKTHWCWNSPRQRLCLCERPPSEPTVAERLGEPEDG